MLIKNKFLSTVKNQFIQVFLEKFTATNSLHDNFTKKSFCSHSQFFNRDMLAQQSNMHERRGRFNIKCFSNFIQCYSAYKSPIKFRQIRFKLHVQIRNTLSLLNSKGWSVVYIYPHLHRKFCYSLEKIWRNLALWTLSSHCLR